MESSDTEAKDDEDENFSLERIAEIEWIDTNFDADLNEETARIPGFPTL